MHFEKNESTLKARVENVHDLAPSIQEQKSANEMYKSERQNATHNLVKQGLLTDLQFDYSSIQTNSLKVFAYLSQSVDSHTIKTGLDYVDQPIPESSNKLMDFAGAAFRRAADPSSYFDWANEQQQKMVGIGEGLNYAKEKTKAAVATAGQVVLDGQVLDFLSKPNAINEPLSRIAHATLETAAENPNALNDAVAHSISDANAKYNALSAKGKGEFIGEFMFSTFNPEGNAELAEKSMRLASEATNSSATNAYETVRTTLQEAQAAAPKVLDHAQTRFEQLFFGAQHQRLAYAASYNVYPKVISDATKSENVLAMIQADGGESGFKKAVTAEGKSFEYQVDHYTKRLQRVENGEVRTPYSWKIMDEKFDSNCLRQSEEHSCYSAVGSMLSGGKISEAAFINEIDTPSSAERLAAAMRKFTGENWTNESMEKTTFAELTKYGPCGFEFREKGKYPHFLLLDGQAADGTLKIRDPHEGTSYRMTREEFKIHASRQFVYKTAP